MSNTLNFTVSGNRLELKDGFTPVNTEHDYTVITVSFEQGSDWENCTLITAGFFVSADQISTVQPAVVSGLTCSFTIPGEILSSGVDEFHFGLTGSYTENESTVTAATNIVTINAQRGVLIGEAVDLSAYEKLLAAINAGLALKEDTANKTTAISESNSNSNTLFPTINAVVQYLLAHFYTKSQLNTEYWNTAVIPFFTDKFVTPEMFGARGNGLDDDSEFIQAAIDNGANKVVLMVGNYKINSTIVITGRRDIYHVGTITYTGEDSAIKIQKVATHCNLKFDQINAGDGNGIEFYAGYDATNDAENGVARNSVQYVKLEFDVIKSRHKCIYLNLEPKPNETLPKNVNWINEIIISGGHLTGYSHKEMVTETKTVDGEQVEVEVEKTVYEAEYGIYGDAKGFPKMNNIKVYNVSIEGIKNGYTDAAGTAAGIYMANKCERWTFINMRCAETFDYVIKTVGEVENFTFYAPQYVNDLKWNFSNETSGVINTPAYGESIPGITYETSQGLMGFTRIVKDGHIEPTLNTQLKTLFYTNEIQYNPNEQKTLTEHKIVAADKGYYLVIINTFATGDHSSIYLVRVNANYSVDVALPIYEGSGDQAPRVTVDTTVTPKVYGLLTKRTSTNTNKTIKTMAIKLNTI